MDNATQKYIRQGVKLSCALGYLPYGWCESTGTVTFDSSPRKRFYFLLQFLLFCGYLLYLNVRALYYSYADSEGITTSHRAEMQYVAAGYWTAVPFQLCSLIYYGRHHVFVNRYLNFQKELQAEWNASTAEVECKTVRSFNRGFLILGSFNIISNVSLIWRNPKAVNLITAMIPNVEKIPKFLLLPLTVIQFLLAPNPWIMGYFYVMFMIGLSADVCNKLQLMR